MGHNEVFAVGLLLLLSLPMAIALLIVRCCMRLQQQLKAQDLSPVSEIQNDYDENHLVETIPLSEIEADDDLAYATQMIPRKKTRRHKLMPGIPACDLDEEEGQCEPMCPSSQVSSARGRSEMMEIKGKRTQRSKTDPTITTVCFRKADWRSRLEKPFVMSIKLGFLESVQDLSSALRQAFAEAWDDANMTGECDLGAMTIEYQTHDGDMHQLTAGMPLMDLTGVKALFVTTHITEAAVFGAAANSDKPGVKCINYSDPDEPGLVDMSLSGCCGIQSSHGGLRITSLPAALEEPELKPDRRAELVRFRAAKFKHYFTM